LPPDKYNTPEIQSSHLKRGVKDIPFKKNKNKNKNKNPLSSRNAQDNGNKSSSVSKESVINQYAG
jgi:hypothetical protein